MDGLKYHQMKSGSCKELNWRCLDVRPIVSGSMLVSDCQSILQTKCKHPTLFIRSFSKFQGLLCDSNPVKEVGCYTRHKDEARITADSQEL